MTANNQTLSGKTAVVTGSSSGIGRAIAMTMARRGAQVVLHGRSNSESIDETKNEIESIGVDCKLSFADFSKPNSLEKFADDCWNCFDGVDIWVNNAGGDVLTGQRAKHSLEEKLDYLQQVDVKATLMLSRLVGKRMTDRGDREAPASIINVGWDQAWLGMEGESGELFATTKGAIMSMTKSLAQSLAPHVRVNCVAPGWIQTDWGDQASEYWTDRARNESLMNRWGTPDDIANAVAFLSSDEASFISGQILNVNGGFRTSWYSQNQLNQDQTNQE